MKVYARFLKEAGLLTTGARGVNAPDMTYLDAARMTIALMATDSPAQCVDRVKQFGPLKHDPKARRSYRGYESIQADEFKELFQGETLEGVLAFILSRPVELGIEDYSKWNQENIFHLRVIPFGVMAEIFSDIWEDNEVIGTRVATFKGDPFDSAFPKIKGGIRTERLAASAVLDRLAIGMWAADQNVEA